MVNNKSSMCMKFLQPNYKMSLRENLKDLINAVVPHSWIERLNIFVTLIPSPIIVTSIKIAVTFLKKLTKCF
jgi:hypothetical protein